MSQLSKTQCIICDKEIEFDHPNRLYCESCKSIPREFKEKEYQKRKYTKNPWWTKKAVEKECIICKTTFMSLRGCDVCSIKCRSKHRRNVQKNKKNFDRIKVNIFKSWVMWGERR